MQFRVVIGVCDIEAQHADYYGKSTGVTKHLIFYLTVAPRIYDIMMEMFPPRTGAVD
jgi:hypothetical protein